RLVVVVVGPDSSPPVTPTISRVADGQCQRPSETLLLGRTGRLGERAIGRQKPFRPFAVSPFRPRGVIALHRAGTILVPTNAHQLCLQSSMLPQQPLAHLLYARRLNMPAQASQVVRVGSFLLRWPDTSVNPHADESDHPGFVRAQP